jgi:FKBP-type peptidyl-prolyl cis-trans isomerase FklB
MRKPLLFAVVMLAASFTIPAIAHAQQIPAASSAAGGSSADQDKELPTPKEKTSYAVGMNIGNELKSQPIELDMAALLRGIQDTLGGKPLLTDDQAAALLTELGKQVRAKQDELNKK